MEIDRLSVLARPPGRPVMYQTWDRLLFMHWPVPQDALRPLIPDRLHIDTFDGTAWVGITPFTMRGIRPAGLPPLPLVSRSHELNVRTYVHYRGVPGVWFLSLDASNPLAVLGARVGFALPYFQAAMALRKEDDAIHFTSRRTHPGAPDARLDVTWRPGAALAPATPGSLAFFLTERYCLYAARRARLSRCRIHHEPWPLCRAELVSHVSTMMASHGLTTSQGAPLLHGQAAPLTVGVWLPERV